LPVSESVDELIEKIEADREGPDIFRCVSRLPT